MISLLDVHHIAPKGVLYTGGEMELLVSFVVNAHRAFKIFGRKSGKSDYL